MSITATPPARSVGFSALNVTMGSVALKTSPSCWSERLSIYVGGYAPRITRPIPLQGWFFGPEVVAHVRELACGYPFAAGKRLRLRNGNHSLIAQLAEVQRVGPLLGPNRIVHMGLVLAGKTHPPDRNANVAVNFDEKK